MEIMVKIVRRYTRFISLVFLVVLASGCMFGQEKDVLGKWRSVNSVDTIEFFKDGTVTMADQVMPVSGSYTFLEQGRIKLDMGGIGGIFGPMVAEIVISKSKDEMIITYPFVLGSIRYARVR